MNSYLLQPFSCCWHPSRQRLLALVLTFLWPVSGGTGGLHPEPPHTQHQQRGLCTDHSAAETGAPPACLPANPHFGKRELSVALCSSM